MFGVIPVFIDTSNERRGNRHGAGGRWSVGRWSL